MPKHICTQVLNTMTTQRTQHQKALHKMTCIEPCTFTAARCDLSLFCDALFLTKGYRIQGLDPVSLKGPSFICSGLVQLYKFMGHAQTGQRL